MYKENVKYNLTGYQVVGNDYNVKRNELAEYKSGYWYQVGCNKAICNFVVEEIVEVK